MANLSNVVNEGATHEYNYQHGHAYARQHVFAAALNAKHVTGLEVFWCVYHVLRLCRHVSINNTLEESPLRLPGSGVHLFIDLHLRVEEVRETL